MEIRRTDRLYGVDGTLNIPSLFRSFRSISKGRKESTGPSNYKASMETLASQALHHRRVIAALEFPSIGLCERYAIKPSLTVLRHFLQLFLGLFRSESSRSSNFVKISAGKFGEFVLDSRILPGGHKGVFQNILVKEISKKIQSGGCLYGKIVNGLIDLKQPSQLEDISNLIWFLQAKFEQKVGSCSPGVISLEDSEFRLLDYFDGCREVSEVSRRFKESRFFQGKEGSPVLRSIDFSRLAYDRARKLHKYLKFVLPYGKCRLLILPMLKESLLIEENRLLLKMENHGACFFKGIGHAWSVIQSLIKGILGGESKHGGCKDERIPPYITNVYKKLMNELKKHKPAEFLAVLEKDNPFAKNRGIHIMARNIESFILLSSKQGFPNYLMKPLNDFYNTITDYEKHDYYHVRIGNEVIFNTKDLVD